jgi:AcrR family transcriptional regulator
MPKAVDIDERRHEITDAAARLIARAGIGAATMRDVAAEAGWTTGTVTHYFADKRELLVQTLQASLAGRRRAQSVRGVLGPGAALRASLAGALPLDDDSRQHWMVTVAFCAQAAGDDELGRVQRDAYRDFRRHIAKLVGQLLAVDARRAVPIAERLIAFTDGVAMQALFDAESWPADHQLAELDRMLADWAPLGSAASPVGVDSA